MRASSVIDVILGEAVSGTREQRYNDMLAIASVIQNRALATGLSPEDIIAHPGEFNAYGRSLPPGVKNHRALAEAAMQEVIQNGPVTEAMYYATPTAASRLPDGLSPVGQTTGHRFFSDPQMRPFRTAQGVVQPQQVASAAGWLPAEAPVPQERPSGGLAAIEAALAPRGPGMAALAPNGLLGDNGKPGSMTFYNPGQKDIASGLADAIKGLSAEFDGEDIGITSGYRSKAYNKKVGGAKNSFHVKGQAVDVDMRGWSTEKRQRAVQELAQRGAGGFITYTDSPDMMHVDMRPAAGGIPVFMHDRDSKAKKPKAFEQKAPAWFKELANGKINEPLGGVPTPSSKPTPGLQPSSDSPVLMASAGDPLAFSPASTATRGSSATAAKAPAAGKAPAVTQRDYPKLGGERNVIAPTPGDRPAQPAVQRLAPAATTQRITGVDVTPGQRPAPAGFEPQIGMGAPSGLLPSAPAPIEASRYTLGKPAGPTPAELAEQLASYGAGKITPASVAPPVRQIPMRAAPAVAPVAAPVQPRKLDPLENFPEPPSAPSLSAYDIYDGKVGTATANGGAQVSRFESNPNTYVTNKWGVTTGTDQRGNSFLANEPGPGKPAGKLFDGMGDGLGDKLKGKMPKGREIIGALAGLALGSAVGGPAAGAVGAQIGRKIGGAMGKDKSDTGSKPGGLLEKLFGGGKGAFPDAPKGGSATKSVRDYSRMEKMSPQATKTIREGGGGLY